MGRNGRIEGGAVSGSGAPGFGFARAADRPRRRPSALAWRFEPMEPRVVPATFTVGSLADAGAGSLRDAIEQANDARGDDLIAFDPKLEGSIVLTSALPDILGNLEIQGPTKGDLTLARDPTPGTPEFRLLTIARNVEVKVSDLTLTGGSADFGGAVNNDGALTLDRVKVLDNTARFKGGGLYNSGSMVLNLSTVDGNAVSSDETLGFGPSTIGRGGGIFNQGSASVLVSTVSHNTADRAGGGLYNAGGAVVTVSTFSGNTAEGFLLAPSRVPAGQGGGIYNQGAVVMDASTIADNAANRDGGGLYNNPNGRRQGVTKLQDNLIADNQGGSLVARSVPINSMGFNLIAAPVVGDFTPNPTDIVTTDDPLLAPLDFYVGGGTKVHALLPGSPAIDAGVAIKGLSFDQRFAPRPVGAGPDIGSFESAGFTAVIAGNAQAAAVGTPFASPLSIQVTSDAGTPVAGGRVIFNAPASGASAVLPDGGVATIGTNHVAQIRPSANTIAGTYTVTARVDRGDEASYTLTNVAPVRSASTTAAAQTAAIPKPTRFPTAPSSRWTALLAARAEAGSAAAARLLASRFA